MIFWFCDIRTYSINRWSYYNYMWDSNAQFLNRFERIFFLTKCFICAFTRSLTFLGVTWARVLRLGGDYQLLGAHSEYLGAWLLRTSSPAGDGSTRPGGGADQAWSGRSCWTASLSCLGTLPLSLSPSSSLSLSLSFSSAKRSAIGHIKMKMRLQYIASIKPI